MQLGDASWFAPCKTDEVRQQLDNHPLSRMLASNLKTDVQESYSSKSVEKWLRLTLSATPSRLRLIVPVYMDLELEGWDGLLEEGKTYAGKLDVGLVEEILEAHLGMDWGSLLLVEGTEDSMILAAVMPAYDGDAHVFWCMTGDLPAEVS